MRLAVSPAAPRPARELRRCCDPRGPSSFPAPQCAHCPRAHRQAQAARVPTGPTSPEQTWSWEGEQAVSGGVVARGAASRREGGTRHRTREVAAEGRAAGQPPASKYARSPPPPPPSVAPSPTRTPTPRSVPRTRVAPVATRSPEAGTRVTTPASQTAAPPRALRAFQRSAWRSASMRESAPSTASRARRVSDALSSSNARRSCSGARARPGKGARARCWGQGLQQRGPHVVQLRLQGRGPLLRLRRPSHRAADLRTGRCLRSGTRGSGGDCTQLS